MPKYGVRFLSNRLVPYVRAAKAGYTAGKKVSGILQKYRRSPKSGRNGTGVTTQHDVVTQYTRKRMPRRKKKRWVRKVKAHYAMTTKLLGTTSIVRNSVLGNGFTNDETNQTYLITHLYGSNGAEVINRENATSDINQILVSDNRVPDNGKIMFTGACLDMTARNTGTLPLEADMYLIIHNNASKHSSSTEAEIIINNSNTPLQPGAGAGVTDFTLSNRGVTPFQFPGWTKMGNKIIMKKKYFLPVGSTFTYQWKDSKNYVVDVANIVDFGTNFVYRNMTKTVMIVFKPLVASAVGPGNTARLDVGCTRSYSYKILENNKTYNGLIA